MRISKKITAIALSLAMIAGLVAINPIPASAKVTIKSGKKIVLTVGKSKKIKVKQKKAKFKTSNKKIATVSKKGKVTAKKPGTCKITVKVGKSSKKVPVRVNLANVSIKSVDLTAVDTATVTWNKVKGASGYAVYYSNNASGGFTAVNVNGVNSLSTKISGLKEGNTYYFKVKAFAKVGKKKVYSKAFSATKSVKTYKLVWHDEFDGNKLDTTKWNNNGATGAGGYGNQELQNYQMKYCEVKDGSLIIKPQFEYNPRTKQINKNKIYSTKLWTNGQYEFTYGKVEFRAKLPKGQGTWAACWMLGNANNYGAWPNCGEIDVLETKWEATKTIIPQSIHCKRFNGMSSSTGNKYKETKVNTATSEYHTYGIIWTADAITFTIDGQETWTYDPNMYSATGTGGQDNKQVWPFDKPFYLILNCAVGGTLGGNVGLNHWTKTDEKVPVYDANGNVMPNVYNEIYRDFMYVDYVRVYQ